MKKKDEDKWKKMKDIIVSIRPRFQPIHWLPFSVAQFFTLSWVEHLSSNIYVHFFQYSIIWIPYFSIHYHLNVLLKLKLFGGLESNLEFETWDRLKSSFVPKSVKPVKLFVTCPKHCPKCLHGGQKDQKYFRIEVKSN